LKKEDVEFALRLFRFAKLVEEESDIEICYDGCTCGRSIVSRELESKDIKEIMKCWEMSKEDDGVPNFLRCERQLDKFRIQVPLSYHAILIQVIMNKINNAVNEDYKRGFAKQSVIDWIQSAVDSVYGGTIASATIPPPPRFGMLKCDDGSYEFMVTTHTWNSAYGEYLPEVDSAIKIYVDDSVPTTEIHFEKYGEIDWRREHGDRIEQLVKELGSAKVYKESEPLDNL
jgi:hypothetical protein